MDDNVKHPEAYPSIERSLDKIVDKMEGNTAYAADEPFVVSFRYGNCWDKERISVGGEMKLNLQENVPSDVGKILMELLHNGSPTKSVMFYRGATEEGGREWLSNVPNPEKYENIWDYEHPIFEFYANNIADAGEPDPDYPAGTIEFGISNTSDEETDFLDGFPVVADTFVDAPEGYSMRLTYYRTIKAYESFKESVPSAEKSLDKIADIIKDNTEIEPTPFLVNFKRSTKNGKIFVNRSFDDIVSAHRAHRPIVANFYQYSMTKVSDEPSSTTRGGEVEHRMLYCAETTVKLEEATDPHAVMPVANVTEMVFAFTGVTETNKPFNEFRYRNMGKEIIFLFIDKDGVREAE